MEDMLARFTISDVFIGRTQNLVHETVIPDQEKVLKDETEGVEKRCDDSLSWLVGHNMMTAI